VPFIARKVPAHPRLDHGRRSTPFHAEARYSLVPDNLLLRENDRPTVQPHAKRLLKRHVVVVVFLCATLPSLVRTVNAYKTRVGCRNLLLMEKKYKNIKLSAIFVNIFQSKKRMNNKY